MGGIQNYCAHPLKLLIRFFCISHLQQIFKRFSRFTSDTQSIVPPHEKNAKDYGREGDSLAIGKYYYQLLAILLFVPLLLYPKKVTYGGFIIYRLI